MFRHRYFAYFVFIFLVFSLVTGATLNQSNKLSVCSSEISAEAFELKINELKPILDFILFGNEQTINLTRLFTDDPLLGFHFSTLINQHTGLYLHSTLSPPA